MKDSISKTNSCQIIKGGSFSDERGILRFVNDFNLANVQRFYLIEHLSDKVIRAWQGHKKENKYFYVVSGSFLICTVKIDNWEKPSRDLLVNRYYLNDKNSEILFVPEGFANGFRALEKNSKLLVFSSGTISDAKSDDYRFPNNYWCNWDDSKIIKS